MKIMSQAFALNTSYQRNRKGLETAMARLASGDKLAVMGEEPASQMSISERFRNQVRRGEASTHALQTAMHYLNSQDAYTDEVTGMLQRMMELAASAATELQDGSDRSVYHAEFETMTAQITDLSRRSRFSGKQLTGRDVIASFDANTDRFKFRQEVGGEEKEIGRDFSATALDARGNLIDFDSSEDYSLSRDGKSLYYLTHVTGDAGGTVRLKSYDIESDLVTTGSDLFATGDKMFVNEDGQLYVNGAGTLYSVDDGNLSRTATLITDVSTGTEFSVYKGDAYYHRSSDNRIVSSVVATGVATNLAGPTAFGAGDHTFAASGKYAAEESVAGSIRVIDTRTGNESTIAIGGASDVVDMHFSESGDRIYYLNDTTFSIDYVNVSTDSNDAVVLSYGGSVAQGFNSSSFQGLDLGGANPASNVNFVLASSGIDNLGYEAVDLDLYALGIANTRIDTLSAANAAIADIQEAQNRVNAARAQTRGKSSRFTFVMNGHRAHIANLKNTESLARDVDMASESAKFANFQVKQQAAQAILAQFNSLSKNVLQLLQA